VVNNMDLSHLSSEEIFGLMGSGVDIRDAFITDCQLLEMELMLMDAVALKRAGGEHMVHWDAAWDYQ